jgi:hypothetical protein
MKAKRAELSEDTPVEVARLTESDVLREIARRQADQGIRSLGGLGDDSGRWDPAEVPWARSLLTWALAVVVLAALTAVTLRALGLV